MKEYIVKKMEGDERYDFIIVILDYQCNNYLTKLQKRDDIANGEGRILIDQLLSNGNSDTRFVECEFSQGEYGSFNYTKPERKYREISTSILKDNFDLLENSILSKEDKEKILGGYI